MRLALRGQRDMDSGSERVTDEDVLRALRAQASRVQWRSLLITAVLTILYLLVT